MSEFLYLYRGGERATTPAGWEEQVQKWGHWLQELGAKGHIKDPGKALDSAGKVVKRKGQSVTDGSFAEKDVVVGYTLVQAEDLGQAAELSVGCPIFETGGWVEVRTVTRMRTESGSESP